MSRNRGNPALGALIGFLLALVVILIINGCYTGHSYHRERAKPETARQQAARKPIVYKRCDKDRCKIYDIHGNRRYDLESPHAN